MDSYEQKLKIAEYATSILNTILEKVPGNFDNVDLDETERLDNYSRNVADCFDAIFRAIKGSIDTSEI